MAVAILILILLIVIAVQNYYIRWLKKEICLRDGTYKPKEKKRLFKRKKQS